MVVNNIKTIIVWAREHPKLAVSAGLTIVLAVIGIIRFILLDIPQIVNNVEMSIGRDNIYLTQFETGRELIPLNIDSQEAPPIKPIKLDEQGSPYTLPALHVTFKQIGVIPFSYQINVNKMDPIRRRFTINVAKNYEDELNKKKNYWTNEVNSDTYRVSFFKHGDDRQSVSPSSCLQTYPAASAPTVSADTQGQN
ncbi:MAG: hypothetical protein V1927_02710 [Candidatus Omnitrophota bacterium]